MQWICRGKDPDGLDHQSNYGLPGCYWREKQWNIGETVEVMGVEKWTYSGGYWHDAECTSIADFNTVIPRHFEPTRKVLVEPLDLLNARMGIWIEPKWINPKEVPIEVMREKIEAEYRDEVEQLDEDERIAEHRVEEGKTQREKLHQRAKGIRKKLQKEPVVA